jgi:hypothetical protein
MRHRQRPAETRPHETAPSRRIGKTFIRSFFYRLLIGGRLPTFARLDCCNCEPNTAKRAAKIRAKAKNLIASCSPNKESFAGFAKHDHKHVIGRIDETKFK